MCESLTIRWTRQGWRFQIFYERRDDVFVRKDAPTKFDMFDHVLFDFSGACLSKNGEGKTLISQVVIMGIVDCSLYPQVIH